MLVTSGATHIKSLRKFSIVSYRFSSRHHHIDHSSFFSEIEVKVTSIISDHIKNGRLKVNFELFSMYSTIIAKARIFKNELWLGFTTNYVSKLILTNIEFPVKLKDISKFEKLNNISVNVFGLSNRFENGKTICDIVGPYYFTDSRKNIHVNLLLITDDSGKGHYCYIKNLSRLVSSQKSRHNGKTYICNGCLQFFQSPNHLQLHEAHDCNFVCTKLPTTDLKLNKYDFERILKPIQHAQPSNESSFTLKSFEHVPYSFCFYVKCKLVLYRGDNVVETFVSKLDEVVLKLYNTHLKNIIPLQPLSKFDEIILTQAYIVTFAINLLPITIKVRDHSTSLEYIAVLPTQINLALDQEKIDVIAQNKEKYISFSKHILVEKGEGVEKDVFFPIFLPTSLDKLSQTLEHYQCNEIRKYFPDQLKFEQIRRKGVFPYSYIDCITKLDDIELPSKKTF
ncbi:hypothetical protein NQ318_015229 [Aromia moschata]|uniref:C2H2-type domain-containing protein n=1 Tax=Aromia moschata TaxID=1265417 RepID=A0AAV8XK79_9CUCU|nr:hypothetical protein NQ318_015229 [Aromia moschata]